MHQLAGCVVDKRQQRALLGAVLKPRVFRAVDLHQLAKAIAPAAWLMRRGQTMAAIDPETRLWTLAAVGVQAIGRRESQAG
jgi:hypothetical protein